MTGFLSGLPLHPAMVHVPIAGALFAALLLAAACLSPRRRTPFVDAALLVLLVTAGGAAAAVVTGWLWADSLAYLAGGGILPGPAAVAGLARQHALAAGSGTLFLLAGLGAALRSRSGSRPPLLPLALVAVSLALVGLAGHLGGTMVHNPPEVKVR